MRSGLSLITSILICFVAFPSFGEIDRSKLPEAQITSVWTPPAVEVWTLENGLSVWYVKQDHTPLVTVSLVLPQGSAVEPPEAAGRSALMVDLMDEGAGKWDALSLSAEMQRLAMDFSSSVEVDSMLFSMNILSEKLNESFALFADILIRPRFSDQDFERRKSQQIASAIAGESNLGMAAFRAAARALYGEGYLGMPSDGLKSTLESITKPDVVKAYEAMVSPKGGVLVVVGSVEREVLKKTLETSGISTWVSQAKPLELKARAIAEPSPSPNKTLHVIDFPGSAQSFVVLTRRSDGATSPERFNTKVFNHSFAGSFTSRVNLNLREDKGYTYGARGGFSRSKKAGNYTLYAKVKRDTTRASLDEFWKELTEISSSRPITQKERDDATNGILKGFPGQFERSGALAYQLAAIASSGRSARALSEYPKEIQNVTLSAAQTAAKAYTDPNEFTVVIAGDWAKIQSSLEGLKREVVMRNADGTLRRETK